MLKNFTLSRSVSDKIVFSPEELYKFHKVIVIGMVLAFNL